MPGLRLNVGRDGREGVLLTLKGLYLDWPLVTLALGVSAFAELAGSHLTIGVT
jgi:hypothetical protein